MKPITYFILLLIGALSFSLKSYGNEDKKLTIYDFDGFKYRLHKDNDTLYVVNFWATWCAPCVKEIPDFEKLYDTYKEQKLKVLFVSLDFPGHIESRVIPFIERLNMQAEVVVLSDTNSNRWIPLVSEDWSGAIPATLIYGKNFREFHEREFKFHELEKIVKPVLLP